MVAVIVMKKSESVSLEHVKVIFFNLTVDWIQKE